METPPSSPRFGGLVLMFEWLLSFLLLVGALTGIVVFGLTAFITFQDRVPDRLAKTIEIEIDPHTYVVTRPDGEPLPYEINYIDALMPLPPENIGLYLTHLGSSLVGIIIGIAGVFQLRLFVRSLRRDHPFIPANAQRLRAFAWLMLFGSLWKGVTAMLVALEASDAYPSVDLNLTLNGEGIPVLTIFTLFIIAEVFAHGVKMKEDADLTV